VKIALIGAPGVGKTHIAKFISANLGIPHIQSDEIFWQGNNLRIEVSKLIENDDWIIEGHISKLSDLVFPKMDKVIVIEGLNIRSLFRSVKRDWRNPIRVWHNIQFYDKIAKKRTEMIVELIAERKDDVLFLNNFPDLSESDLTAFCKTLKPSPVKAQKPAVKRQRS
jgi:adenylate kinase family enzyme